MNWKPQECFVIRFSDETGLDRTEKELEEMVDKLREVSNEYGFDLSCYGSWESIRKLVVEEERQFVLYKLRSLRNK